MPLPILALAVMGGIISKAFDPKVGSFFDEIATSEGSSIKNEEGFSGFEEEAHGEEVSEPAENASQAAFPLPSSVITLRRGDRFICPETGQELQVRAVGGRPMHQPQDDFRYS